MEYELEIIAESKNNLFLFKKPLSAETIDEIVDYVNEMATIYKKSSKLTVVIYDENKKKIAMYDELSWLMYWLIITNRRDSRLLVILWLQKEMIKWPGIK